MNKHRRLVVLLLVCGLFSMASSLRGATRTWTGGSPTSGNWTIPSNWDGGASSPSNGDELVFPATAARKLNTNNFASFRASSITFEGVGGGYNLYGNGITVSNSVEAFNFSGSNAIHLDVTMGKTMFFATHSDTGHLGMHGDIAVSTNTLNFYTRGLATITGIISGPGHLIKTGTNYLYLDGNAPNTYAGITGVLEGTLQINHPQSLGSTSGPTVAYFDGALRVDPSIVTLAEELTLYGYGAGNLGVLRIPGDTTFTGQINVLSNDNYVAVVNVAGGHTATFSGRVRGTGTLRKFGTGTLILSGPAPNTPELGVYMAQGVLDLHKTTPASAIGPKITIPTGFVRAFDMSQFGPETDVTLYDQGVLDFSDLAVEDIGKLSSLGQPGGTLITPSTTLRINGQTNLGTTFNGNITGPGAVEVRDYFQMIFNGTNTYTGLTRVINAGFVVNGILASRAVDVDVTSQLYGEGRVNVVTNYGRFRPGYYSSMTTSNAVLQSGSIMEVRYNDGTPNLFVRGSLRLNSPTLQIGSYGAWTEGTSWKVIDNDGVDPVIGQFLNLPEGGILNGFPLRARITYFGGDGNDVVLTATATRVWDGGGANEYWTNPLNWVGDVAPMPGDSLRFPGFVNRKTTNDYPAGVTFHRLTMGNGPQELHGNMFRLTGGVEFMNDIFGNQNAYIYAPVDMTATQEILLVSAMQGTFRGGLSIGDYTIRVRCTEAINNGLVISGPLSGAGNFIVRSNAYVTLNATNSFTGLVQVSHDGVLTGSGLALAGSAWVVTNDARLRINNGRIPGATVLAGGELESVVIGPGTTNIIAGNLLLEPNALIRILTQPASKLIVTGSVTVAGATLAITPYDYFPQLGDRYVIVHNQGNDPVIGAFAGLPEAATFNYEDAWYRISYVGGDGNDIELTLLLPPVTGVTRVWDGGGDNNFWYSETNWVGNVRPAAGDTLVFPVAASRKVSTNDLGFWGLGGFESLRFLGSLYDLRPEHYENPTLLQNGLIASNATGTNIVRLLCDLVNTQTWSIVSPASVLRFTGPTGGVSGTITNTIGSGAFRKAGPGRLDIEGVMLTHTGSTLAEGGTVRLLNGAAVSSELRLRAGTLDAVVGFSGPFVAEAGILRLGGYGADLGAEQPNGLLVNGNAVLSSNVVFAPRLDGTNEFHPTLAGSAGVLAFNNGTLDLGGATLDVNINCYPKVGDVFTIALDLDENGNHLSNTFAGLPEGSIYQTGPWRFQIGYQAKNNRAVQLTTLIRAPEFTSVEHKEGQAFLEGLAEKSRPVRIQASTNLSTWSIIGQVNADANGAFSFTDAQAGLYGYRFYRAIGL